MIMQNKQKKMYYLFSTAADQSFSRCGLRVTKEIGCVQTIIIIFLFFFFCLWDTWLSLPESCCQNMFTYTPTKYTSTKAQKKKHVFVLLKSSNFIRQKHDIWDKMCRRKLFTIHW